MGELIELTSWPNHSNVFYKITSSALSFEIKCAGGAAIGLVKRPKESYDVLIAIGDNNHSWIRKSDNGKIKTETPNIISSDEYRRFWIKWYGDLVRFGRDGETTPIVSLACQIEDLKYVTFTITNNFGYPAHWRFEVPPKLEKSVLKPITGGELHWVEVDAERRFPDDALIGGFEKENLYVIRAKHRGSLTPGKFVSSEGVGYISWGGEAHDKDSFEVLCGFDCKWDPCSYDCIPVGAVVGGHSEDRHRERLYIGRIRYKGNIIPGKVQPSHRVCYVSYNGKEIGRGHYEILVVPDNMFIANDILVPRIIERAVGRPVIDDYSEYEESEPDDEEPEEE